MNKPFIILLSGVMAALVYVGAGLKSTSRSEGDYMYPAEVKSIIDKSCYGCHSMNGKSDDAKKALRWDAMHEYDKKKMLSVMDEIIEVIEKQEMPPKKFLEKKPEVKPSEEDYAKLMEWAEQEAEKLLK